MTVLSAGNGTCGDGGNGDFATIEGADGVGELGVFCDNAGVTVDGDGDGDGNGGGVTCSIVKVIGGAPFVAEREGASGPDTPPGIANCKERISA